MKQDSIRFNYFLRWMDWNYADNFIWNFIYAIHILLHRDYRQFNNISGFFYCCDCLMTFIWCRYCCGGLDFFPGRWSRCYRRLTVRIFRECFVLSAYNRQFTNWHGCILWYIQTGIQQNSIRSGITALVFRRFFSVVFCVSGCTALSEAVCTVSVAVLSLSDADISTDGETLSSLTADSFFPSSEQPVSRRDIVTNANTIFSLFLLENKHCKMQCLLWFFSCA